MNQFKNRLIVKKKRQIDKKKLTEKLFLKHKIKKFIKNMINYKEIRINKIAFKEIRINFML